jgi:hypothetical protein
MASVRVWLRGPAFYIRDVSAFASKRLFKSFCFRTAFINAAKPLACVPRLLRVGLLPPHITLKQAKAYATALKGDPDTPGVIKASLREIVS